MRRLALLAVAAALSPAVARVERLQPATRISAPLADPRTDPGVARCTIDGGCAVTRSDGRTIRSRMIVIPASR